MTGPIAKGRHEFVIEKIAEHNYRRIAEIGVMHGNAIAERVIKRFDLEAYIMVEMNCQPRLYEMIQRSDVLGPHSQSAITLKPVILMRMTSEQASLFIMDFALDMVFIDASHGYKNCLQDIELWIRKIHGGGIIAGHDYFIKGDSGVRQAVTEFFGKDNFELVLEGINEKTRNNYVWWTYV